MRHLRMTTVAHCITVSENAIRVQLPGGDLYAPALKQAAAKTGARSGLSRSRAKALNDLVEACIALLNSGKSTMITLQMQVHEDSVEASLEGKGCSRPAKKLTTQLESLASKKARSFESTAPKGARLLTFEV